MYVSLTSNDPSLEVKAFLDEHGGMPMLKGAVAAFASIARLAAWERARVLRAAGEPRRPAWPALVDGQVPWGLDAVLDPLALAASRGEPGALPERESLERLARAGLPVTAWRAVEAEAGAAIGAWRALGGGPVALKLDAPGLAHKSDAGGVSLGLADEASIASAVDGARRGGHGGRRHGSRPARRADGGAGRRADRRRAARRRVRAGGARRVRRDPRRGARRRRGAARAGRRPPRS